MAIRSQRLALRRRDGIGAEAAGCNSSRAVAGASPGGHRRKESTVESLFNVIRSNVLVQAILSIALGLFLVFWPGVTVVTLIYLFGALFALSGAASVIAYFRERSSHYRSPAVLATGVLFLLLGLVAFLFPQVIAGFFSVVLGIVLALCGIVSAVRSLELRQYPGYSWVAALVVGALVAIGGIVILVNPFQSTVAFVLALGVALLVNGVVELFIEGQLRRLGKLEASSTAGPRTRG